MASFPSELVHREPRNKLGKGQHVPQPPATVAMTSAANTATLTFSVPVVVSGPIPVAVGGGLTIVSQTFVSSTVVQQLYSGPLAGLSWSIAGAIPQVATFQGGTLAPASGTF